MSDEIVPSWGETAAQAAVGAVPVIGGFVQPIVVRAMAADRRRNAEIEAQLNASMDEDLLADLRDQSKVDAFVLQALSRAKGVAWRQQRELLVDVVAQAIKDHAQGEPTAIDDSELLVAVLMEMTPVLIAGLVAAMHQQERVAAYREAKATARESGSEPPEFEPGEPLSPLVKARLIALGLLELGPTTFGQTPFVPSPAASVLLELCSPLAATPIYD